MKTLFLYLIITIATTLTSFSIERIDPGYTYAVYEGTARYSEYDAYGNLKYYTITYVSNPIKVDFSKYTLDHARQAFNHRAGANGTLIHQTTDRGSIYKALREKYPELMKRGHHKKITISSAYIKKAKEGKLKDGRR